MPYRSNFAVASGFAISFSAAEADARKAAQTNAMRAQNGSRSSARRLTAARAAEASALSAGRLKTAAS